MLRILLIIVVALAVIIGLMRLTGAKPGATGEPAATPTEATGGAAAEGVIETPPGDTPEGAPAVGETVIDEAATEATEAVEGVVETGEEAVDALPDAAPEIAPPAEESVAEPAPETPGR
jgi:hypothetical protein